MPMAAIGIQIIAGASFHQMVSPLSIRKLGSAEECRFWSVLCFLFDKSTLMFRKTMIFDITELRTI
jgi:hypothetical protein